MIKFALQLARTSRSALVAPASELWDLERLAEVVAKMKESERTKEMKSLHGLMQQLVAVLNVKGGSKSQKEKKGKKAGPEERMDVDEEPTDTIAVSAPAIANGDSEVARAKSGTGGKKQRREERRPIEELANGRPVVNGIERKSTEVSEGEKKSRVVAKSHRERSQKKHKPSNQSI